MLDGLTFNSEQTMALFQVLRESTYVKLLETVDLNDSCDLAFTQPNVKLANFIEDAQSLKTLIIANKSQVNVTVKYADLKQDSD